MRAGTLVHRVEIREQKRTPDGVGGYAEQWQKVDTLWADVLAPTGRSSIVADQIESVVSLEVRIREGIAVKSGMRAVHEGVAYRVEAVLPDYKSRMQRLLCSTVTNQ